MERDAASYREAFELLGMALRNACLFTEQVDLRWLSDCLSRADAIGWALDPTAYRGALDSGSLDMQRALVKWATTTRAANEELRALVVRNAPQILESVRQASGDRLAPLERTS